MSKHIDKNTTLLWGHGPMHVDIISPKYCASRPNRNKFVSTVYHAFIRTYMPHADAAARTSANMAGR